MLVTSVLILKGKGKLNIDINALEKISTSIFSSIKDNKIVR